MKELDPKVKKLLAFLKNKYVIASVVFILILLFSSNNIFYLRKLSKQKKELIQKKDYYEKEIERDSVNMIRLQKNLREVERYGREKYMMKRENEDIYIIKSSQDTTNSHSR